MELSKRESQTSIQPARKATPVRLGLNVRDLDEAIDFYSQLFAVKVNKRKHGHANCAIDPLPLKLVLFENSDADERLNHLGVEVFDDADVRSATDRLKTEARMDSVEDEQTCGYATQNKVWAVDPQGMRCGSTAGLSMLGDVRDGCKVRIGANAENQML